MARRRGSPVLGGAVQKDVSLSQAYVAARDKRSGGFIYSRNISDRLGSSLAALAIAADVHPTCLTLANLVFGIAGSITFMASASRSRVALEVVGAVLWQLAYLFDCADGQVARATGKTSRFGASVDILTDFAVQTSLVVAISSVLVSRHEVPGIVVAVFVAGWFVNFVTFLQSQNDGDAPSLLGGRSVITSLLKLPRDYGFAILLLSVWVIAAPSTVLVPVLLITACNLLVLAGSIARDAVMSIRVVAPLRGTEGVCMRVETRTGDGLGAGPHSADEEARKGRSA